MSSNTQLILLQKCSVASQVSSQHSRPSVWVILKQKQHLLLHRLVEKSQKNEMKGPAVPQLHLLDYVCLRLCVCVYVSFSTNQTDTDQEDSGFFLKHWHSNNKNNWKHEHRWCGGWCQGGPLAPLSVKLILSGASSSWSHVALLLLIMRCEFSLSIIYFTCVFQRL